MTDRLPQVTTVRLRPRLDPVLMARPEAKAMRELVAVREALDRQARSG